MVRPGSDQPPQTLQEATPPPVQPSNLFPKRAAALAGAIFVLFGLFYWFNPQTTAPQVVSPAPVRDPEPGPSVSKESGKIEDPVKNTQNKSSTQTEKESIKEFIAVKEDPEIKIVQQIPPPPPQPFNQEKKSEEERPKKSGREEKRKNEPVKKEPSVKRSEATPAAVELEERPAPQPVLKEAAEPLLALPPEIPKGTVSPPEKTAPPSTGGKRTDQRNTPPAIPR